MLIRVDKRHVGEREYQYAYTTEDYDDFEPAMDAYIAAHDVKEIDRKIMVFGYLKLSDNTELAFWDAEWLEDEDEYDDSF